MANILYGRRLYGRWRYAGHVNAKGKTINYPLMPGGYAVKVYNSSGQKLAEYGSAVQNNPVLSASFELLTSGCSDFTLVLAYMPSCIAYGTRIDIHLLGDSNPWYSGYVTAMPKTGTTKKTFTYKGSGFYDQLERIIINRTYAGKEIAEIVKDIMTTDVEPNTDIVYNASQIYSTDYIAGKIKFGYVTANEALGDLKDFASNYVMGVDANRQLFFRPVSTDTVLWLQAGYHVQTFEPEESIDNIKNHIYVKASGTYVTTLAADVTAGATSITVVSASRITVGDTLTIDDEEMYVSEISGTTLTVTRAYNSTTAAAHTAGALIDDSSISTSTTRILAECTDTDSVSAYGLHSDVLSIPSCTSEDDAARWGAYQLSKYKNPTVTASLKNVTFSSMISAGGKARVTSEDGNTVYTLPIVKVTYSITSKGLVCNLSLGALPADNLDNYLATMLRNQRNAELLSQYASEDD